MRFFSFLSLFLSFCFARSDGCSLTVIANAQWLQIWANITSWFCHHHCFGCTHYTLYTRMRKKCTFYYLLLSCARNLATNLKHICIYIAYSLDGEFTWNSSKDNTFLARFFCSMLQSGNPIDKYVIDQREHIYIIQWDSYEKHRNEKKNIKLKLL